MRQIRKVDIEFTGERVVPGKTPPDIYKEHIDRYIFAASITKKKDVLDVACGTGYGLDYLIKNGAKSGTGADLSYEAVEYAENRYGVNTKANFLCANCIRLPFLSSSFDVVVSFETLEHIGEYGKYLAECRRVLKRNGILICSTPNRRVFSPNLEKPLNPFHVKEFWPQEFHHLLSKYYKNIDFYGQCDVTLADNSVEREYGVREFKDNESVSSAYIIAVAIKKGNGLKK